MKMNMKIGAFVFFVLVASSASVGKAACGKLCNEDFMSKASAAQVGWLIDRGMDVNGRGKEGHTPLHLAAEFSNNPAVVQALIDRGARVNARDDHRCNPLHYAAGRGNIAIVQALLAAGVDVNAVMEGGVRPLHRAAAFSNNPTVVRRLVKAGALLDAKTKRGKTPADLLRQNVALRYTNTRSFLPGDPGSDRYGGR